MMTSTCHFYLCYHGIDPFCYGDYTEAEAEQADDITLLGFKLVART